MNKDKNVLLLVKRDSSGKNLEVHLNHDITEPLTIVGILEQIKFNILNDINSIKELKPTNFNYDA